MDPVVAARAARGLQVAASDYVGKLRRHQELKRIAFAEMAGSMAGLRRPRHCCRFP